MKTIYTLILLFFATCLSAQNLFIANRGASYLAPENTLAAVKQAWESGTDAVMVNVRLSKDNRLMVIYDKTTRRTCSGKKTLEIETTPSMLLRDLDAGSWKGAGFKGEKIPYLSEIIETIPENKTLFIDLICGDEALRSLKRTIEKSGKQKQLAFISSEMKVITEVKKAYPENKCYWSSDLKIQLKKKAEQAIEEGLTGISLKHNLINEEITSLTKDNNIELLSFTVDDPAVAKELLEAGVTGIITNRPVWLKNELK